MQRIPSFILGALVAPLTLLGLAAAFAGSASLPHTFQSNTVASAADVNANFEALRAEINDNHLRIEAIEQQPLAFITGPSQSVPDDSTTFLTWSESGPGAALVTSDPLDLHDDAIDPERITVPLDGYYYVYASVRFVADANGDRCVGVAHTFAPGSTLLSQLDGRPGSAIFASNVLGGGLVLKMNAGSSVRVYAGQDSGAALSVKPLRFGVAFLRPLSAE